MSQVVLEQMESRSYSSTGGKTSGSRTFVVYDDATPITQPASITFGSNGMPASGDLFPGETELFAQDFTVSHIPDSSYTWRVVWNYTPTGGGGQQTQNNPSEPGYLQVSIEYSAQFKDFYRNNPGLRMQSGTPDEADIGGAKIDSGGTPLSVLVMQQRLVLEETVESTTVQRRSTAIRLAVGRRNLKIFYGAQIGTLVYEGASARRISLNAYSLSHRFMYDEFYHMAQSAQKNANREVITDTDVLRRATNVRWIQPYPNLYDMNTISENF